MSDEEALALIRKLVLAREAMQERIDDETDLADERYGTGYKAGLQYALDSLPPDQPPASCSVLAHPAIGRIARIALESNRHTTSAGLALELINMELEELRRKPTARGEGLRIED